MVRNKLMLLATAGLLAGALLAPQAASAKTIKVKIVGKGDPTTFPKTAATLSGTFGKGKQAECCAVLPKFNLTWTFGGKYKGKLKVETAPPLSGTKATGPWKIKSGTGKFKGAKVASSKVVMDITDGSYVWTGKVTLK